MNKYERRYKILSSAPVIFITYGVLFGLLLQANGRPFAWRIAVTEGVVAGTVFTLLNTRKSQRARRARNMPQTKEQWELFASLREDRFPTGKKLLKDLPEYLDIQEARSRKALKSTPLFVAIFFFGNLLALADNNVALGILATLDLVFAAPYIHAQRKILRNIASFREQLG